MGELVVHKCSRCGWETSLAEECDAEIEFSNHECPDRVTKPDSQIMIALKNVELLFLTGHKRYAIYVGGSSIGYYKKRILGEHPELYSCEYDDTNKNEMFGFAKVIAEKLGMSAHYVELVEGTPHYKYEINLDD
ncbi:hypothetical protein [Vibrio crassostreae]|uniref:hypothetical protein n=1 Tax=Vibrio crassostreae TaxID=246167 RepID=UPI001B30482D|nr:hypothetical protein [Vibrio crassostreae]